jgi:LAGLIDADG endonuclease
MPTGSYRWNPDLSHPNCTVRAIPREGQEMRASQASYLAGFLDGDGSIHFQLVRQKEYRFGFYIRASMSLSQSTSCRKGLEHIQVIIGGGYLRDRRTGMSDLVVTSRPLLLALFSEMEPYVIFNKEHVREALRLLPQIRPRMRAEEFLKVAKQVDVFSSLNYSKTKRITAADVEQHLRSKGFLCPRNDLSNTLNGQMEFNATAESMNFMTRRPLETG